MSITIKSKTDLEKMRIAGRIAGNARDLAGRSLEPGMTTKDIDKIIHDYIVGQGAVPSFLGYGGFPGSACISVNDELVHGAPNSDYALEDGDKVSFDLVIRYKGYCTDAAFTTVVGKASPAVKNLIRATEQSLWAGIYEVRPGAHLGDIGHAVETVLRKNHLGVIENYVGHFIGKEMHQEPDVPNGYILKPGDTLCIEPMSSLGKPYNYATEDWTVILADGSIGCHCEHTILVTEDGYEVLTLPNCPEK